MRKFIQEQNDFSNSLKHTIESALIGISDEIESVNILQKEVNIMDIPDLLHFLVRIINSK